MARDDPPAVRRLLLVGFMGSGKSTVGRSLARRLGWTFLDIDEVVAEREGRSIARIFSEEGEAHFRRREHEATMEQLSRERVVIATGGGWPVAPGRLDALGPDSCSVWLDVPLKELERRLAGTAETRPLLTESGVGSRIARLLESRRPYYARATFVVEATGGPEAVTERILAHLHDLPRPIDEPRTQDRRS